MHFEPFDIQFPGTWTLTAMKYTAHSTHRCGWHAFSARFVFVYVAVKWPEQRHVKRRGYLCLAVSNCFLSSSVYCNLFRLGIWGPVISGLESTNWAPSLLLFVAERKWKQKEAGWMGGRGVLSMKPEPVGGFLLNRLGTILKIWLRDFLMTIDD